MTTNEQRPRRWRAEAVEGDAFSPNLTTPPALSQDPEAAGSVPEALVDTLRRLADALERLERPATPPRMGLSLREIAAALAVSPRLLQQQRAAGRWPAPDIRIGRLCRWSPASVMAHLGRQAPGRGGRAS
jgi:hypothetical protein